MADNNEDLLGYEEEEAHEQVADSENAEDVKGTYTSIRSLGFGDFLLKNEILRAMVDCGFEAPSEVQQKCIPQAVLGMDLLCQAKSGTGKTAVFILATLQQIEPVDGEVAVLVLCHKRELAFEIYKEYGRLSTYMNSIKIEVFCGGYEPAKDKEKLKKDTPHIIVGTPGRILALIRSKTLKLSKLKHFVLYECEKMLELVDMRRDVQEIYRATPHRKQVMMYSATLAKKTLPFCRKFMHDPFEAFVDDEAKVTLPGLQQHYVKLSEKDKDKKLFELLELLLEFNQVVIFTRTVNRCEGLTSALLDQNFPAIAIHSGMKQDERLVKYNEFKDCRKRILVTTNVFGRGIDIERVNIVFNYDMPESFDTYIHRVARAGRFGKKGLAITFVSSEKDQKTLNKVQERFDVGVTPLPEEIDLSSYREGQTAKPVRHR